MTNGLIGVDEVGEDQGRELRRGKMRKAVMKGGEVRREGVIRTEQGAERRKERKGGEGDAGERGKGRLHIYFKVCSL